MKKVRFETPVRGLIFNMNERECHSPRPFTEKQIFANAPDIYSQPKILTFNDDPVELFECSNSSPYPTMNKTKLNSYDKGPQWSPCNDLELSILDATNYAPRKPTATISRPILKPSGIENINGGITIMSTSQKKLPNLHGSDDKPPNVLVKDDDFFLKRDNLGKLHFDINPLQQQITKLSLDKENNPLVKKAQMVQMSAIHQPDNRILIQSPEREVSNECSCHHCVKKITPNVYINREQICYQHAESSQIVHQVPRHDHCSCVPIPPPRCSCCIHTPQIQQCSCKPLKENPSPEMNAVDKKTWAIEKFEQNRNPQSMEVEKQANVIKEKREPTVSDLFKIIKLQNEQLQLLQEKVDKFITINQQKSLPVQSCMSEHVAIETVDNEHHKISIGVMTSFEMVRTSTVINKEVVKTNDNSQFQCNKSQISIKEVLTKSLSPQSNFLDGIAPVSAAVLELQSNDAERNVVSQNGNEEKTLNELSLYNVQVDNATTPMMSPDQSLYLDVRDYSDSEAGSDDQSNVGWTYYNKVMTHVNGMLQDADMPSSASAMYRNTRQQMQTVQMQIDKTNVSVTKRVKFGDDPLGIHQPHIYAGSSDTSLKMNQLAAKYLKNAAPAPAPQRQPPRPITAPIDMSFATRNYMEKHKLLQGVPVASKSTSPPEMPRFLDITALKQQPKFL